jgi:hypothetical protein
MASARSMSRKTRKLRGVAFWKARTVRDFAADWKRWSLTERVTALVVVVLLALAISIAATLVGH